MAKKTPFFYDFKDNLFKYLVIGCSLVVVVLFSLIFILLVERSLPALSANGIDALFGTVWDVNSLVFGALPAIIGTLISAILATSIAVPISLGIAIFFTEYAPDRVRLSLSVFIDLLAAIPSVIYGIWGLWIISPLIKNYVQQPIVDYIGFIPLFAGPAYGLSIFLASIILTIMVVPIISSITIELLSSTPNPLKEGMISLGATKWETVRNIAIPFAKLGIFSGIILGLGRALGETMAVTMVIGNSYLWPFSNPSLFAPATTITSKIAGELYEASNPVHVGSLIELALVLLIITLAVNFSSRAIIRRIGRRALN